MLVCQSKTFVKKRLLEYQIVTKTYQNLPIYVTIEGVVTQNCFHPKTFIPKQLFHRKPFFYKQYFSNIKQIVSPNKKTIHKKKISLNLFLSTPFFTKILVSTTENVFTNIYFTKKTIFCTNCLSLKTSFFP